jgi:hypothetical protein
MFKDYTRERGLGIEWVKRVPSDQSIIAVALVPVAETTRCSEDFANPVVVQELA